MLLPEDHFFGQNLFFSFSLDCQTEVWKTTEGPFERMNKKIEKKFPDNSPLEIWQNQSNLSNDQHKLNDVN